MASTWNVDARDTVARPSRVGAGATARLGRRVRTTWNDNDPTAMGNDDPTAMGNDDPTAMGNDDDPTAAGNDDGDPTTTRPPDDGTAGSTRGRG